MDTLDTLRLDIAFDVKFSKESFGGYAPAPEVLANRVYGRVEEAVRTLLSEKAPSYWMERASEYAGRTYQVGTRANLREAEYDAEIERLASVLRGAGYAVRLRSRNKSQGHSPSLYLTLDKTLGEAARAAHLPYLRILSEAGALLPEWAKEQIS